MLRQRSLRKFPRLPFVETQLPRLWPAAALFLGLCQQPAEAQDGSPAPVFELRFEADSVHVVRNEIRSSADRESDRRDPKPFPIPAVANFATKQVVWFDADGTIRKIRRYSPEAVDLRVSDNGKYVLVTHEMDTEFRVIDLELLDAQGTSLWRTKRSESYWHHWSPTGETVVGRNGRPSWFLGPEGMMAEYQNQFTIGPAFSSDGRLVLALESEQESNVTCLSLFDKRGQRVWKRHCRGEERLQGHRINYVSISETGRYIAYASYDEENRSEDDDYERATPWRHLAVLDSSGDLLWTRSAGWVHEVAISEQQHQVVALHDRGIRQRASDFEAMVLDARTATLARRYPLSDLRFSSDRMVIRLVGDDLVLGYSTRSREWDYSAHLRVYDSSGALSSDRHINPETEDWAAWAAIDYAEGLAPAWSQHGSFVGVSTGRSFELFDLGNLREE